MKPKPKTESAKAAIGYHLAMRAIFPNRPNTNRETCVRIWAFMRNLFPEAHAATIMPDHLHLIATNALSIEETDRRWRQLTRWLNLTAKQTIWERPGPPVVIPNRKHLGRQVRYVHLNPCRDHLCADPIEWEWSTHREFLGAVANPWPETTRSLALMQFPRGETGIREFHHFVSADYSVNTAGTPPPDCIKPGYKNRDAPVLLTDFRDAESALAMVLRARKDVLRTKGTFRSLGLKAIAATFSVSNAEVGRQFNVHPTLLSQPYKDPRLLSNTVQALRRTLSDPRFMKAARLA